MINGVTLAFLSYSDINIHVRRNVLRFHFKKLLKHNKDSPEINFTIRGYPVSRLDIGIGLWLLKHGKRDYLSLKNDEQLLVNLIIEENFHSKRRKTEKK